MVRTNIIRSVTTRLRRLMSERRKALRRGSRYEARLPFIVTPLGSIKLPPKKRAGAPALVGHTRDLSETSMTLLLPSVRVGNIYLTDGESYLEVRLELPDGQPVSMLTSSVRFEQLPSKDAGCGYLLAVHIVQIEEKEQARYLSFLESLKEKGSRTRERRQATHSTTNPSQGTSQPGTWDGLTTASINNAFERFLNK